MTQKLNRREVVAAALGGLASFAASSIAFAEENPDRTTGKLFLFRYDTEADSRENMRGFLKKVVEVHRRNEIPATFFCKGATLELMKNEFGDFYKQVKNDRLFDIQNHSYSHIGLGYERGKPVEVLKADYEKSFAVHERLFGVRPVGISICGTSGADGPHLSGFDATEKSRAELDMVASLGVRMIDSFLTGIDGSRRFVNYGSLGHPDVMGFPSGYSDTAWMWKPQFGDPVEYVLGELRKRAEKNEHMPLMMHDWVAWMHAPDQELTHVSKFADAARKLGYKLVTHIDCLRDRQLWA